MKNNIFKHELNESSQAKATLNCLKNRNNPQKLNEALPLLAPIIRVAMPLLRPIIIKLVKSMVMKAGAKLTGRQVAKAVIKNVSNGKTLMRIGKKVGQTWNEIPVELKQEIAKTAVDTFKQMRQPKQEVAPQEQEKLTVEQEKLTSEQEEFTSEQERHDIALATTYCLGESFIDNDGDLDDIYYAVLKVFDSTHDAPKTTDYKDVLQWCRKHYKQIEKLL